MKMNQLLMVWETVLQNKQLLAKLSNVDVIAQCIKFDPSCLAVVSERDHINKQMSKAVVFWWAYLENLYDEKLTLLGFTAQVRPTYLKERRLQKMQELEAHIKGRYGPKMFEQI